MVSHSQPTAVSLSIRIRALRELGVYPNSNGRFVRNDGVTTRSIASKYDVTERTIQRWLREKDLSVTDMAANLARRGRKRKISAKVEEAIVAFVDNRLATWNATQVDDIVKYVKDTYEIDIPVKYASLVMRRNGFASLRALKRPLARTTAAYQYEVEAFREIWARKNTNNYFVLDETGLWNDSVVLRSYSRRGVSPYVHTNDKSQRDTAIACICGNGQRLPLFYVRHIHQKSRNRVITQNAIKGVNTDIFLDYIEQVLKPNMKPGQVLFMDQLSVHKTKRVQEALQQLGIVIVYFPAKAATELSPLDNCFFHLFKDNFRRRDRSTPELKKQAAIDAYAAVSRESILSCWRKCKLLVETDASDIIDLEDTNNKDEVIVLDEFE